MRAWSSNLPQTCGVGCWYDFGRHAGAYDYREPFSRLRMGGIGYTVAGFVNTKTCQKAYNWIAEHKEIVFQSPVKKNSNSRRQFFFIVFKNKE